MLFGLLNHGGYDFLLVQFNLKRELSPWNFMLVTKSEAATHDGLFRVNSKLYLEDIFTNNFCQHVLQREFHAKRYFSKSIDKQGRNIMFQLYFAVY